MTTPNLRTLIAASLAMAGLAGCATMAADPTLQNARQKVAQVQSEDEAVSYDQPDIDRARQLLASADQATRDGYSDLARHDAYLAMQIASVAEQTGDEHAALDHIAAGETERQQIQLEARNRELTAAREQTQVAEQRAQNAEAVADQATTQEMQSELAALNAQQTDRGLMVNIHDDQFVADKATLTPDATPAIDQLAQFLNAHPERRVLAEGHTDSVATDDYSLDLSGRRAQALKDALVQRGISADRIDVAGQSKEDTVASNGNSTNGEANRWVEVIISDAAGQVAAN